jgi:hypothetical protein
MCCCDQLNPPSKADIRESDNKELDDGSVSLRAV